jgi:hypothetical protein
MMVIHRQTKEFDLYVLGRAFSYEPTDQKIQVELCEEQSSAKSLI